MVALAHRWRDLIRSGVVKDQAALAAPVGVSRARISQVIALLYLAPDIQEELLFLVASEARACRFPHSALLPLAAQPSWLEQRRSWRLLREAEVLRHRGARGVGWRGVPHRVPVTSR